MAQAAKLSVLHSVALLLTWAAIATAFESAAFGQTTVTLTFEGLQDSETVLQYYNGGRGGMGSGPGSNYGIYFGSAATSLIQGALGNNFSRQPSGTTIVSFLGGVGVVMNVPAGFRTGFSFYYASANNTGVVKVYDGLDGSGNLLTSIDLAATGALCDPQMVYSCWLSKGVTFSGAARSVNFSGSANNIAFDNITLGSSTPAAALNISTTAVSSGSVGASYNQSFAASGGTAPYSWSATGLPGGLSMSSAGVLSGTPTAAGSFNIAVTVSDASSPRQSATKTFTLSIGQSSLEITTSSVGAGNVGIPYSQSFSATGGTAPYTWSASGLPGGLSMSSAGVVSGIPTASAFYSIGVTVTDSSNPRRTTTRIYTLNIAQASSISVSLASAVTSPTDQPGLRLTFSPATTVPVTGTLTLSFAPTNPNLGSYIDPAVRFAASGATTLSFTLPAGTTTAALPSNAQFSQGTVAGTITVTLTALAAGGASILPNPRPSTSTTVNRMAPVITPGSVRFTSVTSTAFVVEIQGFSTTRDLAGATVTFAPAGGASLDGSTTFTVSLATAQTSWFDTTAGRSNGSRFSLLLPFAFNGSSSAIGAVTVTLSNSAGSSASVTGSR